MKTYTKRELETYFGKKVIGYKPWDHFYFGNKQIVIVYGKKAIDYYERLIGSNVFLKHTARKEPKELLHTLIKAWSDAMMIEDTSAASDLLRIENRIMNVFSK